MPPSCVQQLLTTPQHCPTCTNVHLRYKIQRQSSTCSDHAASTGTTERRASAGVVDHMPACLLMLEQGAALLEHIYPSKTLYHKAAILGPQAAQILTQQRSEQHHCPRMSRLLPGWPSQPGCRSVDRHEAFTDCADNGWHQLHASRHLRTFVMSAFDGCAEPTRTTRAALWAGLGTRLDRLVLFKQSCMVAVVRIGL